MYPVKSYLYLKQAIVLVIASSMSTAALAETVSASKIELPNEHEFIRIENVSIVEKEGKTAINGSAIKFRDRFMIWGSHLHIDLVDLTTNEEGEVVEVLLEREVYRFRRNDFDDGERLERFFKYVDLSNPNIDKIVLETYTQRHDDTCGLEEQASD